MARVYRNNPVMSSSWAIVPTATGKRRFHFTQPLTLHYPTGGPDLLPAWVFAVGSDSTPDLDLDHLAYVVYTVVGSNVLRAIEEWNLATLDAGADYATLFWLINGRAEDRE